MNVIQKRGYNKLVDLSGKSIDKWTVVSWLGNKRWLCRCACGTEASVNGQSLRCGDSTQCGACGRLATAASKTVDLTGGKFNRWTFLRRIGGIGGRYWEAKCECGNVTKVFSASVTSGLSKGCGNCGHFHLPGIESAINYKIREYKSGAKSRGYAWALSKQEVLELVKKPCFYCGKLPTDEPVSTRRTGKYTEMLFYNGIDRSDNSLGYVPGNVVSCCFICNRAKRELSVDVFLQWIQRIATSSHVHMTATLQQRNN